MSTELWAVMLKSRLLRRAAMGLAAVSVLSLLYVLVSPDPEPIAPDESLFQVDPIWPLLKDSMRLTEDRDFVRRPLLSSTRRPPVPPPPKQKTDSQPPAPEIEPIDGVELRGIFGNSQFLGAILQFEDGARKRVLIGESVRGWRLVSLESRRATFEMPGSERRSHLEMKFAEITPLPVIKIQAPITVSDSPKDTSGSLGAESNADSQGGPIDDAAPQPLTFESIDRRRRESLQEEIDGRSQVEGSRK